MHLAKTRMKELQRLLTLKKLFEVVNDNESAAQVDFTPKHGLNINGTLGAGSL